MVARTPNPQAWCFWLEEGSEENYGGSPMQQIPGRQRRKVRAARRNHKCPTSGVTVRCLQKRAAPFCVLPQESARRQLRVISSQCWWRRARRSTLVVYSQHAMVSRETVIQAKVGRQARSSHHVVARPQRAGGVLGRVGVGTGNAVAQRWVCAHVQYAKSHNYPAL